MLCKYRVFLIECCHKMGYYDNKFLMKRGNNMPSNAYKNFNKNIKQVDKLLEAYDTIKEPTRGRKHLDHFTRAALIFMCSAWEVYVEEISRESVDKIVDAISSPDKLPLIVQKTLSRKVKEKKNEIEPIEFAKDWKGYYKKSISEFTDRLNTPKNQQVTEIFNKYLGMKDVKDSIPALGNINEIVKTRGEIAHNVFAEEYLSKNLVLEYLDTTNKVVKDVEIALWDYLPIITNGKRPWQNTYK